MARIKVRDGETITTETIVAPGDILIVKAGGTITRADAAPAVRITGADATIRNEGTIAFTGVSGYAVSGIGLTGVLDLRIANSGTIGGTAGGITLGSVTGTTGDVRVTNSGTITGGTGNAVAMRDVRATTITVVNEAGGLITNAGTADVVRPGHDLLSEIRVVNSGTIRAGTVVGGTSGGDGVDLQSQDGGVAATILNLSGGLIEGGKHAVTGANGATIVNEAGASLIGRNGSGLNFDTELADGDGAVTVVNHGLISGRYDGFGDGDGDGVDVDYLVDVENFGTIEGVGADNIDDFADGIAAGGGRIVNAAGATIHGETNGILIDDGDRNGAYAATRIVNDGTISADLGHAIRLIGDFADTIVNRGTITNDSDVGRSLNPTVEMGGGNDRFVNAGSVETWDAVVLDMGDGDDIVLNKAGRLGGEVRLGAGNDSYVGSGGTSGGGIYGGDGDDVIVVGDLITNDLQFVDGGAGRDEMTGGHRADYFVFSSIVESSAAIADADVIRDFGYDDRIVLSAIDADATADGDQAFAFIADSAFSGTAGELRATRVGSDTIVEADVDGDAIGDFTIVVADHAALSAGDFYL